MKPFRILIESGMFSRDREPANLIEERATPAAPAKLEITGALKLLADARANLKVARDAGNSQKVLEINNWYGGGLAILSEITGRSASSLTDEMIALHGGGAIQSLPTGQLADGTITNGKVTMVPVQRQHKTIDDLRVQRENPHRGAPRDLDPSELSEEEREALGILIPGVVIPDSDEDSSPSEVAPED